MIWINKLGTRGKRKRNAVIGVEASETGAEQVA